MTTAVRALALLLWCAAPALAQAPQPAPSPQPADETPQPNPARPTVSTPATLTPVGYLQFENGLFFARTSGEFTSQFSVNQVTKLAVLDRVQLSVQSEPFAHTVAGGQTSNNFGGIGAGVQVMLLPGKGARPTVSVAYSRPINGGSAAGIDIGSADQTATALVSMDLGAFHVDTNAIFSRQSDDAQTRTQNGETLSVAHPAGRFTIATEVWRFSQPLLNASCAGFLVALSHPVGKFTVVDAGFNRGLTKTSTRWEVFAGFTYLLPKKLW